MPRKRSRSIDEKDRLPEVAASLAAAARRFDTPLYAMDLVALDRAAERVVAAFPDPWLRSFSVKANDVPSVVAAVADHGFGANVVSRGEWALARRAGVPSERITLEGVGKTDADLHAAVRASITGDQLRWVAIESADELSALAALAERAGLGRADRPPLDVLLRLNPSVAPETMDALAVGRGASKFGLGDTELTEAVERWGRSQGLALRGIHLHVGSQLGAVDAWRDAVRRALALLALVRGGLPDFDTLDVGGGFPVAPPGNPSPGPERFAREVPALLEAIPTDRRPARMAVEPGRVLVARAGWLVARVLHVRQRGGRQVVLDAGMTELIRPALYGAVHPIVALTTLGRPCDPEDRDGLTATRVEGPICESTDALGVHDLPPLARGDIVAIGDAGAYAASQSSRYNGRPRPPQVLIRRDGSLDLVRPRGRLSSLA